MPINPETSFHAKAPLPSQLPQMVHEMRSSETTLGEKNHFALEREQ
jgi:hypothetical protein